MTILGNQGVQTDREVMTKKPDLKMKKKKDKTYLLTAVAIPSNTCLLKHVAIPSDRNAKQNEAKTHM
jgi:hypothetical protein